ncbi:hypothetical protein MAPG_00184, partial [Magnaporthiopsis poae ATCC 64411]
NLRLTVQDLARVEPVFDAAGHGAVEGGRVRFIAHDFFEPQPVKGADVVGGGDDEATQQDLPRSIRTMGTATDLRLMALFNARERPVGAWKGLLAAADERFRVVSVKANPGEFFAVIEAVWTP